MTTSRIVQLEIPEGQKIERCDMSKKDETTVETCERLVGLMTDPSDLLYESLTRQEPEQLTRSKIYNYIGTKKTMPYKPINL